MTVVGVLIGVGCLRHFCLGLETTQVEESTIKTTFKLDATREPITNEKMDGAYSRCNNCLLDCSNCKTLRFSAIVEDSNLFRPCQTL